MAKTISLEKVRSLSARVSSQLHEFMEEEEPKPSVSRAKVATTAGLAGALGTAAGYNKVKKATKGQFKDAAKIMDMRNLRRDAAGWPDIVEGMDKGLRTAKKPGALYRVADKGMTGTAGVLRKAAGGISKLRGRLHGLQAKVDGQLREFMDDEMDSTLPSSRLTADQYVGERTARKKRRQVVRAGMAGAAVAGGVVAATGRAAAKRGVMKAGQVVADKTGDALFAGSKAAKKAGMQRTGKVLGKGANKAWKGASKLMLSRFDRIARGLVEMGV